MLVAYLMLVAAAAIYDVKADGGFNIEALETSTRQQRLMVGFRIPLLDNQALSPASRTSLHCLKPVSHPESPPH